MADLRARLEAALGDAYRLERELGGGGMTHVFLAEERALSRNGVIKVLPPEMAAGVNAERFRREIQLAASLQHPHIVPPLSSRRLGGSAAPHDAPGGGPAHLRSPPAASPAMQHDDPPSTQIVGGVLHRRSAATAPT